MTLYKVISLNENPMLGMIRQNGPSRLIHDVINIPNIGFSFRRVTPYIWLNSYHHPKECIVQFCQGVNLKNYSTLRILGFRGC
jgi:hypothetical protein